MSFTFGFQLFGAILLLSLISQVIGHSYVTSPVSRSNQAERLTGCRGPNCLGPCDAPLSGIRRAPITAMRGDSITVKWPRNNHAGGFIRFAWAPTSQSDTHAAFDAHVQQINCHEVGGCHPDDASNPNGGDSGPADGSSRACSSVISVPLDLTDGQWTLQWSWFGGAFALGDYYSCVDYKIGGGPVGSLTPVFIGGDFSNPGQDKCKFFNTDKLHVCVDEPCQNAIYPTSVQQSGSPAQGQLGFIETNVDAGSTSSDAESSSTSSTVESSSSGDLSSSSTSADIVDNNGEALSTSSQVMDSSSTSSEDTLSSSSSGSDLSSSSGDQLQSSSSGDVSMSSSSTGEGDSSMPSSSSGSMSSSSSGSMEQESSSTSSSSESVTSTGSNDVIPDIESSSTSSSESVTSTSSNDAVPEMDSSSSSSSTSSSESVTSTGSNDAVPQVESSSSSTTSSPSMESSSTTSEYTGCVLGSMVCVGDGQYQTCTNGRVGNYWSNVQNCHPGLSCHPSGSFIYCY